MSPALRILLGIAFVCSVCSLPFSFLTRLVMLHWGIDTLPSVGSLLEVPVGDH